MSLRIRALLPAANTGSAALTMETKETAPAPRANTPEACDKLAKRPTGASAFQFSADIFGTLRRPVAHMGATKRMPTRSCTAASVQVALAAPAAFLPRAMHAFLLKML